MDDITIHVTLFENQFLGAALLFLVTSAIISAVRWFLDLLP